MNNYAYDDSWNRGSNTAEQQTSEQKVQKQPELVRSNNKKRILDTADSYIKIVVCGILATVALFTIMNGLIKCNELDIEIDRCKKSYTELKSEHVRLTAELEEKQSRDIIENYAINVLGMQPVQDYQKNTIKIERRGTLVSVRPEENDKSMTDLLSEMFSKH